MLRRPKCACRHAHTRPSYRCLFAGSGTLAAADARASSISFRAQTGPIRTGNPPSAVQQHGSGEDHPKDRWPDTRRGAEQRGRVLARRVEPMEVAPASNRLLRAERARELISADFYQGGSYPQALRELAHSAGVTAAAMRPMAARRPSRLRSAAFLTSASSLAKAFSIEVTSPCRTERSRGCRAAGTAGHAGGFDQGAGPSWLDRVSMTTMSLGRSSGTSTFSTQASKVWRLIGPGRTNGATMPRMVGAPPNVVVLQWP